MIQNHTFGKRICTSRKFLLRINWGVEVLRWKIYNVPFSTPVTNTNTNYLDCQTLIQSRSLDQIMWRTILTHNNKIDKHGGEKTYWCLLANPQDSPKCQHTRCLGPSPTQNNLWKEQSIYKGIYGCELQNF